jgi:2'-hydroxybiphenyl-2-sulfinate desulfinase
MSVKEFRYTICPVGNASFIAANREEFLQQSFQKRGIKPVRLQTLPVDQWHVHFDYQDDALFREGGNIPPIWAKSNGTGVVLIGYTFLLHKSYVLTRIDSPIDYVEQLRGGRLGIPVRPEVQVVDFFKAEIQRSLLIALNARGVTPGEVNFVELPSTEAEIGSDPNHKYSLGQSQVDALDGGRVDAVIGLGVHAQRLIASGKYKIIYELTAQPKLVAPLGGAYPNILTVSKKLAEESPEIVVEYIKQLLLAAEWAKTHLPETLELFSRQLHGTVGEVTASLPINYHKHLAPVLDQEGLLALESQKRFLFDYGFITKDFDIENWADPGFLKAAHKEIENENEKEVLKNAS